MHDLFPGALVDCLKSGALPTGEQLDSVALYIWRDWCCGFGVEFRGMPSDPSLIAYLGSHAWLALTGEANGASVMRRKADRQPDDAYPLLDIAC